MISMKLRINSNLQRVEQVWLSPVSIQYGHSLDRSEAKEVCDFVSDHRYELEREYQYNRLHGAD